MRGGSPACYPLPPPTLAIVFASIYIVGSLSTLDLIILGLKTLAPGHKLGSFSIHPRFQLVTLAAGPAFDNVNSVCYKFSQAQFTSGPSWAKLKGRVPEKRWILKRAIFMSQMKGLKGQESRLVSGKEHKVPIEKLGALSSVPSPATERLGNVWTSPVPSLGPSFLIYKNGKIRWFLRTFPALIVYGYMLPTALFMASTLPPSPESFPTSAIASLHI